MEILVFILEISIKKRHFREVSMQLPKETSRKNSLLPNCIEASDG